MLQLSRILRVHSHSETEDVSYCPLKAGPPVEKGTFRLYDTTQQRERESRSREDELEENSYDCFLSIRAFIRRDRVDSCNFPAAAPFPPATTSPPSSASAAPAPASAPACPEVLLFSWLTTEAIEVAILPVAEADRAGEAPPPSSEPACSSGGGCGGRFDSGSLEGRGGGTGGASSGAPS